MVPRVPDRFDVQKLSGFTPLGVGKRQLVGKMRFVQELVVTRGVFLYEEWSTVLSTRKRLAFGCTSYTVILSMCSFGSLPSCVS